MEVLSHVGVSVDLVMMSMVFYLLPSVVADDIYAVYDVCCMLTWLSLIGNDVVMRMCL